MGSGIPSPLSRSVWIGGGAPWGPGALWPSLPCARRMLCAVCHSLSDTPHPPPTLMHSTGDERSLSRSHGGAYLQLEALLRLEGIPRPRGWGWGEETGTC